jgi:hypothetical protein
MTTANELTQLKAELIESLTDLVSKIGFSPHYIQNKVLPTIKKLDTHNESETARALYAILSGKAEDFNCNLIDGVEDLRQKLVERRTDYSDSWNGITRLSIYNNFLDRVEKLKQFYGFQLPYNIRCSII